jgi:hypothetical protein
MVDRFDDIARETGARIVHFCGHDSVPWDLCVYNLAQQLRAKGQNLKSARLYDSIRGTASGGTLETVFAAIESRGVKRTTLPFDPLLKLPGSATKSTSGTSLRNQARPGRLAALRARSL